MLQTHALSAEGQAHLVLVIRKVRHALGFLDPGVPDHGIWKATLLHCDSPPFALIYDLHAYFVQIKRAGHSANRQAWAVGSP